MPERTFQGMKEDEKDGSLVSFFFKYHPILQGPYKILFLHSRTQIKWHLVNEGNYTLDGFLISKLGKVRVSEHEFIC